MVFCLIITAVPSYLVPSGGLRSFGSPGRAVAIAMFALFALGFIAVRKGSRPTTLSPGTVVVLAYFFITLIIWGVGLLSTGSAAVEAGKRAAFLELLADAGIALYAIRRVRSARDRSLVLGALAVGLTFSCGVGVLQNATPIDLHLAFAPPGFIDGQVDIGHGLDASVTERFGAKRAFGIAAHPIEFAVLAAATVPLALHFTRFGSKPQIRLLALIATVVAVLAIPSAVSRSGIVALAAAMLIYVWALPLRRIALALLAGGVIVAAQAAIAPTTVDALWQTVVNSSEDTSVLARIERYARVSETFRHHPFFGIGLGATPTSEYGPLDNQWLQSVVQGGLLGLSALLLLSVGSAFGMAAALRRSHTRADRDACFAIAAMIAAILASSFTFDLFAFQQATFIFFVLFGLLWSAFRVEVPACDRS